MSRKMAGFEVVNLKGWKCTNCGASGTGNSKECSTQMKAHREASPNCDESKKVKPYFEPSVKTTESEAVQSETK